MASDLISTCPKFDPSDYRSWRADFTAFVKRVGVAALFFPNVKNEAAAVTAAKKIVWAALLSCNPLRDQRFQSVVDSTTESNVDDILTSLDPLFQAHDSERRMAIFREVVEFRFVKGEELQLGWARYLRLLARHDKLCSPVPGATAPAPERLSDDLRTSQILTALKIHDPVFASLLVFGLTSQSWTAFQEAMTAKAGAYAAAFPVHDVKPELAAVATSASTAPPSAVATSSSSAPPSSASAPLRPRRGHQPHPSPAFGSRFCYVCGDPEHLAPSCPRRVTKPAVAQRAQQFEDYDGF